MFQLISNLSFSLNIFDGKEELFCFVSYDLVYINLQILIYNEYRVTSLIAI